MNTSTNNLAMVFPGQGSQSVGMLAALAADYPQVAATFTEASDALGYDLWQLVQQGPEDELNRTDRTQPAMLAAGVAVWRAWQAHGGARPALMAGHSLGEYTALVSAGAIDFGKAVALVAERGRCMQTAVPEGVGAMAVILGLDDAAVSAVCAEAAAGEVVIPVNFNSPGQVVIAGHTGAVERAVAAAKAAGAKRAVTLAVSVPAHCALMEPAAQAFAEQLAALEIRQPDIPVLQNVDATAHSDPDVIRGNLDKHLYSPVQWVKTIQAMRAEGIEHIIEAGPGKVLAGLCKRIDKAITSAAVYDPATLDEALAGTEQV